ncbi:MAG TPA: XRE family transcriptional regulator [Chthoniobacteraceae bacterium]|jgi:Zn-dependent peptidase ImmA (M78 family)/DNA-binding XRE family transcriptional regulator|nr:XRE family transcriptional regulator [Chthoniobacteraceae bacterium]
MPDNVISFSSQPRPSFIPARLTEARQAQRMTMTDLANAVWVTPATISNYEAGAREPDSVVLTNLCRVLDMPLTYFVTGRPEAIDDGSTSFFRRFGAKTKVVNNMLHRYRVWSGETTAYLQRFITFPEYEIPSFSDLDETVGEEQEAEAIEALASECRKQWGLGNGPIGNAVALLESKGVIVIQLNIGDLENVDGFSCWQIGRPFIFLEEHDCPAVRSRFNVLHEAAHLILHRHIGMEELENPSVLKRVERQANRFASAFLLPQSTFRTEVWGNTISHFLELKRRWKVSIAAMGHRCKQIGIFDDEEYVRFRKQLSYNRYLKQEPMDSGVNAFSNERNSVLPKAIDLLLTSGLRTASDIQNDIRIGSSKLAMICGVDEKKLTPEESVENAPIIQLRQPSWN